MALRRLGCWLYSLTLMPAAIESCFFSCLNNSGKKIETWVTLLPRPSVQLFIGHLLTCFLAVSPITDVSLSLPPLNPSHSRYCPAPPHLLCSLSSSQTTLRPTWQQPSGSEVHIFFSLCQGLIIKGSSVTMSGSQSAEEIKGSLTETGFLCHFP